MPDSLFTHPIALICFGIFVGVFSGLMGLGGGAVMIPLLVLLAGFAQGKAQAVSLAVMIPPVTLPAVIRYFQEGKLTTTDLWTALIIAGGFACGSYFGSYLANWIDRQGQTALKLTFGFILIYVAGYTVFGATGNLLRTVIFAAVLVAVAGGMFGVMKWWDGRPAQPIASPSQT
jgi:uncharacterized membrane protein YfcA